jgi:hypothetical protein
MKLFRKSKVIAVPVSPVAYLIDALAVIFLVTVFVAIDRHSHSASDTLYNFFPYLASTFLLIEWLAGKTSE